MAESNAVPYGRKTQKEPTVKEVHVLWITADPSCDGDSISVTSASQPSIEDIVMGAIPALPNTAELLAVFAASPITRSTRKPSGGIAVANCLAATTPRRIRSEPESVSDGGGAVAYAFRL